MIPGGTEHIAHEITYRVGLTKLETLCRNYYTTNVTISGCLTYDNDIQQFIFIKVEIILYYLEQIANNPEA